MIPVWSLSGGKYHDADLKPLKAIARLSKRGCERDLVFPAQVKGPPGGMGNRRKFMVSKRRTCETWELSADAAAEFPTQHTREAVESQPSTGHHLQRVTAKAVPSGPQKFFSR